MKRHWSRLCGAAAGMLWAGACSCSGGEPSDPWADLSGTIYVLRGFPGPLAAVDPRSGDLRPVPGMPWDLADLAAPADGRMLVVGDGRIFLFNPWTHDVRTILDDQEANGSVAVESNTLRIVYRRTDPNGIGLFARDTFSAVVHTLVPSSRDEQVFQPTWVGSDRVVFVRNHILMGPARRLWQVSRDGADLRPFGGDTGWVSWSAEASPSGEQILGFRFEGDTTALFLADSGGRGVRDLVRITPGVVARAAWSPDESYLVFCSRAHGPTEDLELLHVATGARRALRNDSGDECSPAWVSAAPTN